MHTHSQTKFKIYRLLTVIIISISLISVGVPRTFGQLRTSGATTVKKSPANRSSVKKSARKNGRLRTGRQDQDEITPERLTVDPGVSISTGIIMETQALLRGQKTGRQILMEKGIRREMEGPDRKDLPKAPGAKLLNRFPYPTKAEIAQQELKTAATVSAPQTVPLSFDGATGPTETGAFPPDTMGAAGPTQFVVFLNGRIRTFNKATGIADGVINANPDVFFAPVISTPAAGEIAFTSDPNVRYDRLSGRWFMTIIDVVLNSTTGATTRANRVLIAVSNTSTIAPSTVWTLYQFQGDATLFSDYDSLGIDANALYIGVDMFSLAGAFNSTKGFVIPKAPLVAGSPATVWAFSGLVPTSVSAGPFAPRGVDNPDPTNTGVTATGYFIGVDNATFNTLMLRRVTNPGSTGPAPTISANLSVTTPLSTRFPVPVPHLGNTGGNNGRLDALDDRLYAATIRNGRLWTAHNIGVNNTGVAGASNNRNAARWYELQDLDTTPIVRQSGTLFDDNPTNNSNQRNYWIPSIMVSGQGHAALGTSIAGANERINAFTTGRLAGDALGTLRDGPGGAALPGYTASSTDYNPPGDPGGPTRRWGDYSFTSLDPLDDMTMWTIQEYCNGTNTYGVRVAKLLAPGPATIANGPDAGGVYNVQSGPSTNVTITGISGAGGLGFYDPGSNLGGTSVNFNHITASISGTNVTVTGITYNSPTSITLSLNTINAASGLRNLTITNPDGQFTTRTNIINIVVAPTAAPADIAGRVVDGQGKGISRVSITIVNVNGSYTASATTDTSGYYRFAEVPTDETYVISPSSKQYSFTPTNIVYNHIGETSAMNFVGRRR